MSSVSAFEAKTRFGELLERVANGEEIIITRHDKAVARIVPEGGKNVEKIRAAARNLRELRDATNVTKASPIEDNEVLSARDEGRR